MAKVTETSRRLVDGVNDTQAEFVETGEKATGAGRKIDDASGSLRRLRGEVDPATRSLMEAGESLDSVGSRAESAGFLLAKAAATLGGLVASVAGVSQSIQTFANFERVLAQVGSVAGATGEEFALLEQAARNAGSTTEFTAAQAGEGLLLLARAGFGAREAIAALPGVLDLAIADAIQLGEAADIASNAINQFGLEASDVTRVSDVLVLVANKSNSSVRGLGESLSYTGTIAKALGIPFEEVAAAIGVLGDAGVQGSRAGTGLNAAFRNLAVSSGPVEEALRSIGLQFSDVSLETNTLAQSLRKLEEAGIGAAQADAIAGAYGQAALLALTANVDKLEELAAANEKADGAARKAAAAVGDNLTGAYKSFRSAVEGAQIEVTRNFEPALRGITDTATEAVRLVFGLGDSAQEASTGAQVLAGSVGALTGALGAGGLATALGFAGAGLAGLGALAIANPLTATVAAIGAVVGAVLSLNSALDDTPGKFEQIDRALAGFRDTRGVLEGLFGSIDLAAIEGDASTAEASFTRLENIIKGFQSRATNNNALDSFTISQFTGLSPAIDSAISEIEQQVKARLGFAVENGFTDGARSAVIAASGGIGAILGQVDFESPKLRDSIFDRLVRAQDLVEAADRSFDALSKNQLAPQTRETLEESVSANRSRAEALVRSAIEDFNKAATLNLLTPEQVSKILAAGVEEARSQLGAAQSGEDNRDSRQAQVQGDASADSQRSESKLKEASAYDKARDSVRTYLETLEFEIGLIELDTREQAIRRVELEAYNKAAAQGALIATASSVAAGILAAQRFDLTEATKALAEEEKRLAEEAKRNEREAEQARSRALDTLDKLNQGIAFDLKTLGLSSEQRRRVYEDEQALQAALALGADEGSRAFAKYLALADEADFAAKGQRAADFLTQSFSDFATQATLDFDSIGDAFEDLLRRLESQIVNAAFQGLFQNLFSNLVGTSFGSALGGAFGFGGTPGGGNSNLVGPPAPGFAGPPAPGFGFDDIGPVVKGLPSTPSPDYGLSTKSGSTLSDQLGRVVSALETIASKSGQPQQIAPNSPTIGGYQPDGVGLSERQSVSQALRRLR